MSWQPIDTAPKDGTPVLLYALTADYTAKERALVPRVGEGLWIDEAWHWANDSCSCCWGAMDEPPTHWMPLPEPPQ